MTKYVIPLLALAGAALTSQAAALAANILHAAAHALQLAH